MPTAALPDNASLEQLRKQAKDLHDLAQGGFPGAWSPRARHRPRWTRCTR
ncbi:MAG TPA: hypothetical protein VK823_05515 [Streptosporangiaceae bacterium]|jgi:hypothetical protein|nr:hypothetical protein [Streptosporangiaceae bacterium]